MRNLTSTELEHVYGGASDDCNQCDDPCHPGEGKARGHDKDKCKSKTSTKSCTKTVTCPTACP